MTLIKEIEKEELFLLNTAQKTLQLSKNINASIEVLIRKTMGISVNVRNGIIENVEFNNDSVLFITVYNKFAKGSVSSKDFSMQNIKKMLEMAVNISKYSSSDFFSGLPDVKFLCFHSMELDLFHPWEFDIDSAIKMSVLSEKAAFKFDKRIVNSEGSFFNSHVTINVFGNSLGMLEKYKSTRYSTYNCMISQDKNSMQRDFNYSISRKIEDLVKPEILGQKTAERALSRLGSRKIDTMKCPVIFSSEISHIFFSHLVNAISGDNVYQKSTFLINDLNMRIFPDWLNIEENPHLKQGLGSKSFDNEGVATVMKFIIQNGILKTWLLNSYNARKLKLETTGNCGGIYNWIVSNSNISFEKLLKKMNKGILVTELMGQGVDIISGNYSRGAIGFVVEKGKISYPINEITISGNLRSMWNNIVSISSDVDRRNNIQCGSILLSEMQISGN